MAAVLTADIVHSTGLSRPAYHDLLETLEQLLEGKARFEFYRGDSFQAWFEDARPAFGVMLQLRTAALRLGDTGEAFDVRCSLGLGDTGPVQSLRTATGAAFVLSGRSFDQLAGNRRLAISATAEAANLPFSILARFTDFLLLRLTGRQAAVIFELLAGHSQLDVAQRLQKAPATISQHVHAAAWPELDALITDYQNLIRQHAL